MSIRLLVVSAAMMLGAMAPPPTTQQPLSMEVEGLRSGRGDILVCVTRTPRYFPDCRQDPDRRHFSVPVKAGAFALGMVPPGDYAIAIIHDENGNGKLDTFAGIPREGVGFSRNPVLRFGAPSYKSAQFTINGAPMRQVIKVRYFL